MIANGRDHAPIVPCLTVRDAAAAIGFYRRAFDAVERRRLAGRDGRITHAELIINGGVVVLSDEQPDVASVAAPELGEGVPVSLRLSLGTPDQVDAWFARATSNGATPEMSPTDGFWGARFAALRDPFGHRWMLNARIA